MLFHHGTQHQVLLLQLPRAVSPDIHAGGGASWCGACNWMPHHQEPGGLGTHCHHYAWQTVPTPQVTLTV